MSLQPLLYLRANCRTLLAPGSGGVTYVAQVVDDVQQRVQVIDGAGSPRDTALTGPRIAEALGVSGGRAGIRAMASLSSGDVVVYANGLTRTQSMASLWLWSPSRDTLKLIAGERELRDASGLGASIDLADATLVRAGQNVWLALRHTDATRCLRLDARELAASGTARLARPFEQVRSAEGAGVRITAEDIIYGRQDGSLWLLQHEGGLTWRISTDGRLLATETSPAARPPLIVPPLDLEDPTFAAKPENVRRVLFLTQQEPRAGSVAAPIFDPSKVRRYPAFEFTGQRPQTIERDAITVRPAFPVHALRITSWCVEPNSGVITAYDAMSGELLRLQAKGI